MSVLKIAVGMLWLVTSWAAQAAAPETGPVVEGYGPVFPVTEGAFNLDPQKHYKVSKDVSASAQASGERNRDLESVARFLNMQARTGTPDGRIDMAVVVHGPAAKDLLDDEAYQARFGMANPNAGLLSGLGKAGVKIYICGQTAAYQGFRDDEFHPAVSMAISAMTTHVQLQTEGYTLIPF